ncbi:MAG: hypothetical protein RL291_690 [Pseudomonadota bacterium]
MTKIEWTEQTWNPIVGCSIVSPGCTNCYAMTMAARLETMGSDRLDHYRGTTQPSKRGPVWTGKVAMAPERILLEPLRRRKPTMYFVNSMGDLFHEDVPDDWITKAFVVMAGCQHHTFQVLTKRAARMREWLSEPRRHLEINVALRVSAMRDDRVYSPAIERLIVHNQPPPWPLPNVWLGVSTERQQEANARLPHLLATPAAVRFISAEPLLGPIDLTRWMPRGRYYNAICERCGHAGSSEHFHEARGHDDADVVCPKCHEIILANEIGRLDWVIVGGESGKNARPMHPDWARSIRDQCTAASVPFFFKQWGEYRASDVHPQMINIRVRGHAMMPDGSPCDGPQYIGATWMDRLGKRAAGRLLDGREWNETPATNPAREAAA